MPLQGTSTILRGDRGNNAQHIQTGCALGDLVHDVVDMRAALDRADGVDEADLQPPEQAPQRPPLYMHSCPAAHACFRMRSMHACVTESQQGWPLCLL